MTTTTVHEETEFLQYRDPNQPNLHAIFWSRTGYTSKPNPNIVLWIHGIGEHSGRKKDLAERLLAEVPMLDGMACYDQRGHGRSDGIRGNITSIDVLVDDFVERVSPRLALQFGPDARVVIAGHSLGGLVAAAALAKGDWLSTDACGEIVGSILSGPAIMPVVHGVVNKMLAPLSSFATAIPGVKGIIKSNGLDGSLLSHDKKEVDAFENDKLVHDKVGLGLAADVLKCGRSLIESAKQGGETVCKDKPCLVLFGELDTVCDPKAGKEYADAVGGEFVEFKGAFHEVHKESVECGREDFFRVVSDFLTKVYS